AGAAMAGPEKAVQIVHDTTDELFHIVDENREAFEQDVELLREHVREILLPTIDTVYAGRLVLGRGGRNLERSQVLEFTEALSELLVRQYADGVLEFRSRDQVEVLPLVGDNTERATRVRTRVTLTNGQVAPIDYVFRKNDGEWKIFDVIVEGISYVGTFRNQVGEQLRREGFEATLSSVRRGDIEVRVDD
ncbi:MAG: MlaC/ttg2D family ABC transporter substrate-binding protein, partial [Wenzhouxiangellaceae bacterium]